METSGATKLEVISLPGETTCMTLDKTSVPTLCSDANGYDMKECDAPVSNKTLAGMDLTGRLITHDHI